MRDIKSVPTRKSEINLDKGLYTGDIGLGNEYYADLVYDDIILVKYIDINLGGQREEGGLIIPELTNDLHWRKGEVLMVGPLVQNCKPGDLVVFPNDKGLPSTTISFLNKNGKVEEATNVIFLNEHKLFARIQKKEVVNG